jgi:hypothetical protein
MIKKCKSIKLKEKIYTYILKSVILFNKSKSTLKRIIII